MGKIKINETASEPIDMKKGSNTNEEPTELIMPIEHYVTVSAKVENPEAGVSVEGVKSAPRKKTANAGAKKAVAGAAGAKASVSAAGRKKALALPAGSIGAAVIDEKEKAANAGGKDAKKVASSVEAAGAAGAKASVSASAKKASMDGMVKPKSRTVEVTEIETTAEEEFEAHRPREKQHDDDSDEPENPRFSKPKALLIGAGVTLAVALIGGLAIGLLSHKDVPRCVVQFESNGGSKIESEEVVCGETVERPSDPTKDGFAFQNWIYGGAPFDFDQMTIDEDMILVAKWQVEEGVETVTVKFDTAGGSEIEAIEVKKGVVIPEPVEPTRTSYEFAGWKLNGEDFDFSQPIEEDVTLVAEWTPIAGGNSGQSGGSTTPSTPEKPKVESLAASDVTMKVGGTNMVDITVKPKDADSQLGVSSTDDKVVTCSVEDGPRLKCVGKGAGEATITLMDKLTGKSVRFKVKVNSDVTFVEMNKKTLSLYPYDTEMLSLNVTANGNAGTITWKSSNQNVATVDATGKVTAVSTGSATITATVGGMSDTCSVTVISRPVVTPDPEPEPKPKPEEPTPGTEE